MNYESMLSRRLVLHPSLRLRPDMDRAAIITVTPPLRDRNYICRLVHPTEAIILCLFNGQRTVIEVSELWAELTEKTPDKTISEIGNVVWNYMHGGLAKHNILIDINEAADRPLQSYDPMQFVIPAAKVNLEERRLRYPYSFYYIPTLSCSQHCIYCYAKTKPTLESELLSQERFGEILLELVSLNVDTVQFSGGEIFCHPNIFKLLEAVINAGLIPDIPTKFPISNDEVSVLRAIGVRHIQFSIDSADTKILDTLIGLAGYGRQALRTLDNLKKAGIIVRTNTVLTPINAGGIVDLLHYLGRLGCVVKAAITPYGRGAKHIDDSLFVSDEVVKEVEEKVNEIALIYPNMEVTVGGTGIVPRDENERKLIWYNRSACTANRDGFIILPDGMVTVCEELYYHPSYIIGDLRHQSVMDVWNSEAAKSLQFPRQTDVPDGSCKVCDEYIDCNYGLGRCWRDIIKAYGSKKAHWPDPKCPRAPKGRRLG